MRRLWPAKGNGCRPRSPCTSLDAAAGSGIHGEFGHVDADAANDLVDRIAVMPGQLTSYDSGGLEIKHLRAEAELKLGARFNLRRFNRAVLDEGVVPLEVLRAHLETWIAEELAHPCAANWTGVT